MERKRWVPGEYQLVNNKRCMQADVDKNDAGEIIGFPDTIRNRIRQAALARLGKPASVEDIGAVINVKVIIGHLVGNSDTALYFHYTMPFCIVFYLAYIGRAICYPFLTYRIIRKRCH